MTAVTTPLRQARAPAVRHFVDLVWVLVSRDVKLRYRGSVLGVLWSQLGPLSVIAVMAFVFSRVVRLHIPHYPVFVFVGMLSWTCFQGSLMASTDAVVSARELVRQPGFPVWVLPITEIATQFVYFSLSLPILLIAMVFTHVPLRSSLVAVPLIMIIQFLLTLGPGYLLSALQVRFRDVGHLVGVVLLPFFYATPVFYAVSKVPARYHLLYALNPLAIVIEGYRQAILFGEWSSLPKLLLVAGISCAMCLVGIRVFTAAIPRFAEEL